MTGSVKFSEIICVKCNSSKIDLEKKKCKECGSSFTDEDVECLLDEAYKDHIREEQAEKLSAELNKNKLIQVCSSCKRACCWYGEFMCENNHRSGIELKTVKELRALNTHESEQYWSNEHMKLVYGEPNPFGLKESESIKNKTGQWSYNDHGNEYWNNDDYETRSDAIEAAFSDEDFVKENAFKDVEGNYMLPIAVGEMCQPTILDGIDLADEVINLIMEHHYDKGGEHCEDYLENVTQEQRVELYEILSKQIEGWANKNGLQPQYYLIEGTEEDEFLIESGDALKWAKESEE